MLLEAAHAAFAAFLGELKSDARLVAVHDSDADGLSAGVVWQRAFERLGFPHPTRVVADRERNAWTDANRARVREMRPDALFVLDLGSQPEPILEDVPTCLIDHHRPDGAPPGGILLSGYGLDPIPNTSLLVWELCAAHTDIADLDWVAALGIIGDLGERAPFSLLTEAKRRYTAKYLREAASLINAARRAARFAPETAARALLTHGDPRSLVNSSSPEVAALREARAEVKAALEAGKKAAPTFAGNVALVRVKSPCQIHPLLAQIWRSRLPGYIILAANEGYLPGRVNFSARSGADRSALDLLRAVDLGAGEGSYGRGHDQASGGSLPVARWNELLRQLGFPETVFTPA